MRLTLTNDDGEVIDSWYLPNEEITAIKIKIHIDGSLPVYLDRAEYEEYATEQ